MGCIMHIYISIIYSGELSPYPFLYFILPIHAKSSNGFYRFYIIKIKCKKKKKKKKLENQDKRKERSYVAKQMHKGKWAPWGNIPPFKTWYIDPNVWHLELNMFPNFSIITNKAIILRCLCHNNNCYLLVWHYLSKKKKKYLIGWSYNFFFIYIK